MNDQSNGAPTNGAATNGDPKQTQPEERGRTRAEERIAALDTSGASLAETIEQLTARLQAATQKAEEAEAGWQRARADFSNFKRRTEEERAEIGIRASDDLLLKVVALADDFDLAIEHVPPDAAGSPWMEGIQAIDRKLRQLLESAGVQPMTAEGQAFDPREHQAISHEESAEVPDGTVLRELQRGYYVGDRVLRPAFVAVASNPSDQGPTARPDNDDTDPDTDKE